MTKTAKPYKPGPNDYQGAELKPHAGMPESRLRAFKLPSRVGGRLYYPAPKRRVETFPYEARNKETP